MNEQWVNWLMLSLFDHFKTEVTDYPVYVPPQEMPADVKGDRYEIIYFGPDFYHETKNEYKAVILINVGVVTNKVTSNPSAHYLMIGKGLKFFDKCIKAYQYGNGQAGTQLAYPFKLETGVKITDIMLFDPVSRQQRSTIEAQYSIQLQGN